MLKTSEPFIKDSLEQQVWRRVQTANSVYHFSHKNQPQMHSKLRGWAKYLSFLYFFALERSGEGGTQWREDEVWTLFPVHEAHQAKESMCEGMDSIALKSGLGSAGHLFRRKKPSLPELSHICTTSDTTLLQPHSIYVFSSVYTVLQAPFLLPQTRGSFHFTQARCHSCRFPLLISAVMSICTALLEMCCCLCSTGREISSLPSPMTNGPSTLHIFWRLLIFLFPLFSAKCIQCVTEQEDTWCFPGHVSNFSIFHVLWPFPWCSQNLRKCHDDMGKNAPVLCAHMWAFSCVALKFS